MAEKRRCVEDCLDDAVMPGHLHGRQADKGTGADKGTEVNGIKFSQGTRPKWEQGSSPN
jgi:hypothetical protein